MSETPAQPPEKKVSAAAAAAKSVMTKPATAPAKVTAKPAEKPAPQASAPASPGLAFADEPHSDEHEILETVGDEKAPEATPKKVLKKAATPKKTGTAAAFAKSEKEANAPKTKGGFVQQMLQMPLLKKLFNDGEPVSGAAQPAIDDATALKRRNRIMRLVYVQSIAIVVLAGILVALAPVLQPVYVYHLLTPEHKVGDLYALDGPNLTNQAVLSWATNSVTEVMTLGFGDFDKKLIAQRKRFTQQGWDSFVEALDKQQIRKNFKERQLVLTTTPSEAPVVTSQGMEPDKTYQWQVQVPVIMTYATNNNVMRRERSVINLTLVRVPPSLSEVGIAIKLWKTGSK